MTAKHVFAGAEASLTRQDAGAPEDLRERILRSARRTGRPHFRF